MSKNHLVLRRLIFTLTLFYSLFSCADEGYEYRLSNGWNMPIASVFASDPVALCEYQLAAVPEYLIGIANVILYPGQGGGGYCEFWYNVIGGPAKWRAYFVNTVKPCLTGEVFDSNLQACVKKDLPRCTVSNPVDPLNGEKLQTETDFVVGKIGNTPIPIKRYYRSNFFSNIRYSIPNTYPVYKSGWTFQYTDYLELTTIKFNGNSNVEYALFNNAEGMKIKFFKQNGLWKTPQTDFDKITMVDAVENGSPVKIITIGETIRTFNGDGLLIKYKYVGGPELTFKHIISSTNQYSVFWDTLVVNHANSPLFKYKSQRRSISGGFKSKQYIIKEVYIGNSRKFEYEYTSDQSLLGVRKYPNNTYTQYHYESIFDNKLLTGITDSKGIRYATWIYNSDRKVISVSHANNADKTDLTYYTDKVRVTNSLNKNTTYHFSKINNALRITQVEGEPSSNCAGANKYITYTLDGLIQSKTDWKGVTTNYLYNSKGQEISRTEAAGTPVAQTILTEWHSTLPRITKITTSEKETSFTYDASGLLVSKNSQSVNL